MDARYSKDNRLEAGTDEAGRGCLAGVVVAAAVIFPPDYNHTEIQDSKTLSEKKRGALAKEIKANALAYAIAEVSAEEIDTINILNASILAMHKALEALKIPPELILVDGNRFKLYEDIEYHCVIKGDSKYLSIAAASILAKTHRDELMMNLSAEFPEYHWDKNKGYPTREHKKAIVQYGLSPHHRKTFRWTLDE